MSRVKLTIKITKGVTKLQKTNLKTCQFHQWFVLGEFLSYNFADPLKV